MFNIHWHCSMKYWRNWWHKYNKLRGGWMNLCYKYCCCCQSRLLRIRIVPWWYLLKTAYRIWLFYMLTFQLEEISKWGVSILCWWNRKKLNSNYLKTPILSWNEAGQISVSRLRWKNWYWLNYWHTLISKGTCNFTSNTLLVRIQYCSQFI